jgi:hypothetical protein
MAGATTVLGGWGRGGGESILIESNLSSLPNYIMGVYLLPGPVHRRWTWLGLDFIGMQG